MTSPGPATGADAARRYERLFQAFERGRNLAPDERERWVAELGAEDEALAREVRRLLGRIEAANGDALSDAAIEERDALVPWIAAGSAPAAEGDESEPLPERIGPYRILRRLGAGGMGVVYEAQQETPHRRVALKLVRPGLAFGERLKRFRMEAEALGRLKHPGIAQIFEFGTCDLGRGEQPYFAMELVEGEPLLVHAAKAKLDRAARLALVTELCDAVEHAHERGVVHRDLKPDNVRIDGDGRAKVLDFGVARVRADDVPLTTIHTAQGQIVGTLTHMAPEQLTGNPEAVGPAADVYALGVIAFELLTGRLPHEVAGLSLTQAVRHITEVEPPKLGTIDRGLRGDLETIVAKALDPDPARRYVTPAALAADLRRFLASEPIAARPAGPIYRARKFTRRHPGLVGGSTLAAVSLSAGLIVAWDFALDARAGRRAAEAASYRNILTSVAASLGRPATDVERARLLEAPESLRGWEWDYLRARTADPSLSFFDGHANENLAMATVDGTPLLAFAKNTGSIEVRDLTTGRTAFHLDLPPERGAHDLALTGTGDLTWIEGTLGHAPYRVRRIHLPSGEEMLERSVETPYDDVVLSPDGRRLIVERGRLRRVVDLETGSMIETSVLPWDLDRGGDLILHQVAQDDIALIELASGDELLRLPRSVGLFDAGTGRLITVDERFQLRVWDTDVRPVRELFATTADLDERSASVAPGDRAVAVIERTGTLTEHVLTGPAAGTARVLGKVDPRARPRYWPDGRTLAIWSPSEIRTWDTQAVADDVLTTHASYVYGLAAEPAAGLVASAGWDGFVNQPGCLRLLDLESGAEVLRLGSERQIASWVDWLPGSASLIAAYSRNDEVHRLDLARGTVPWIQGVPRVQAVACSPDGTSIALATASGELRLLDAADGHERWRWGHPDDCVLCEGALAWSPKGKWIVLSARMDRHVLVLLDPGTGTELRAIDAHGPDGHLFGLDVSPDGRELASASNDGTVRLWRPESGEAIGAPFEHDEPVMSLAFHPDGARLATGTRAGVIRIWKLDTHEELLRLAGHTGYVRSLEWIDAGRTLLSASGDGTVRRWSARTAPELAAARMEHARLVDELGPRVEAFLADGPTAEAIDAWLETCAESPRERQVARQLVVQRRLSSTVPAPR